MPLAKTAIVVAMLVIGIGLPAGAQQHPTALTNKDIIEMTQAGLSETVIVSLIRSKPHQFSVAPSDLVALKKAGVADTVIEAMVTAETPTTVAPRPADKSPSPAPAETTQRGLPRDLYPVKVDGKWGFIDRNGTIVITPAFQAIRLGTEEPYLVRQKDWVFVNRDGSRAFDSAFKNYDSGVDPGGNPYRGLQTVYPFADGVARVCDSVGGGFFGGKIRCGYINTDGRTVLDLRFSEIELSAFSGGVAFAGGSIMDATGKTIVSCPYGYNLGDEASFNDGLLPVIIGQGRAAKIGFIDKQCQVAIPPRFDGADSFSDGMAAFAVDGKWGYVASTGQVAVEPQFEEDAWARRNGVHVVQPFSDGLAAVVVGRKWGYIDKAGRLVIPPQFDTQLTSSLSVFMFGSHGVTTARPFHEGLAAVHLGNRRWAYIDKSGQIVIRLREESWSAPGDFQNGIAPVWEGEKLAWIDHAGNYVWTPRK